jgi:hypothetical protein
MTLRLWLLTPILVACSEASFTKTNGLPTANITYPSDEEVFQEGYTYTLRGMVGDVDHDFIDLQSNWLINGEPHCENVQPDDGGLSQCMVAFDLNDTEITLEVFDPNGASAVDYTSIVVEATEAPFVEITLPTAAQIHYSDQLTTLSGVVSDAEDAPDTLNVEWTSSLDGVLEGNFNTPDSNGSLLGSLNLSEGEHFLTLEAVDSTGKNSRDAVTITVLGSNSNPVCSIVFPLENDILPSGSPIAFSGTASDTESLTESLSTEWHSTVDGFVGAGSVDNQGNTLLAVNQLSLGPHTITLSVMDDATGICEDTVDIVVNTPPTAPSVTLTPTTPDTTVDIVAQASGSTDAEGASISYGYVWTLNGIPTTEVGDTFASILTEKNDTVQVSVTPNDGLSDGSPTNSAVAIVNAPPTFQSLTLSQNTAPLNTTVDCLGTATDPDPTDVLTITYQWSDGSTGSSYTTQIGDTVGSIITCTSTVDDADGGTDQLSTSFTIANTDPQSIVNITPSSPSGSDPLTCTVSASDVDGHTLTHAFSWTVNGQPIQHSGLSSTETEVSALFGSSDIVECTVTTTDGFGGSSTDSASVTITNTAPNVGVPTLSPTPAYTNDLLVTNVSASDADGDTLSVTYDWLVDGQLVQSGVDHTLDGTLTNTFEKHQTVSVTAYATDGTATTSQSSSSILIQNTPPFAATLALNPTTPLAGDPMECTIDTPSTDVDNDTVTYTIDWTVDGTSYFGATTTLLINDTIPLGITQNSEQWTCTATPNDGDVDGLSASISTTPCNSILNFDGDGDYITLDPLTSMPNDKTMEAWVRLDAPPSNGQVQLMSSRCGSVWLTSTEIYVNTINNCSGANGGCKVGYNNSTSWVANNQPGNDGGFLYTGWDGSWKHIAVTITSNDVATLYIDGAYFDSTSLSLDGCISATTIGTIGQHNVYGVSLTGDIAEVRMSSAIEYSSGFTPQYPLPITNNTELLYGLQNDFGLNTVSDDSGNGVNGTLTGTSWALGGPSCP